MTRDDDDELVLRLIERLILAARHRALIARFPDHASGFRKMAFRHEAVAAALVVKITNRQAQGEEACRSCPFARRS